MTKIYIASDHAGLELKSFLVSFLKKAEMASLFEVQDLGPFTSDSVDYPDFADLLCHKISTLEIGILICGSGQGMSIRANKYPQIRAALCWNEAVAELARSHNDANVLCLGSRLLSPNLALNILNVFLNTPFERGRHEQRVLKLKAQVK